MGAPSLWHSHNHNDLTHSHDYSQADEEQAHGKEAHIRTDAVGRLSHIQRERSPLSADRTTIGASADHVLEDVRAKRDADERRTSAESIVEATEPLPEDKLADRHLQARRVREEHRQRRLGRRPPVEEELPP